MTTDAPPVFTIPFDPAPYVPRLPVPDATPVPVLDEAVAELRASADAWVRTSPERKLALLDEVMRATLPLIDEWTRLGSIHEGLDPAGPDAAEETIVGPYILLRGLRLHRDAVASIIRDGVPRIPGGARVLANGRVAARVMPHDLLDRVAYLRMHADVWMDPSVALDELPSTMATAWRTPPSGRVCLVLGAGNASSIGPLDAIHKLFVEQQVVVLKLHPVMAHLAGVQARALAPLVREGVLRIVHGDATQGAHLVAHPGVDTLHITGSDRTYEAIVYGTGPEGADRKRRDDPVVHKPFTSELGNLTPIIVVPGRWSNAELDYHAENITTMLTNNAGFNCTTSRVIVTAAGWPQRGALLDRIRRRLGALPTRLAYYPGAAARFGAFREVHPEAELFGGGGSARGGGAGADGHLPWMLIPGLSPDATGDPCYRVEAFCSVTAETPIDAADAADFLAKAAAFANDALWGTLNATLIVDPRTAKDPAVSPALERAIEALRYGTVSLNHWSAAGYGIGITPWGAYPGHPRHDIGSGTGFVHNPLMFDRVEKTVIRGPFRAWPKPPWFSNHAGAHKLMPELTRFEADHHPGRLLPIAWYAARG
jgi:acyl-CoA reductase-like NAD-dependent aldehyde dehydrogenase